MATSSNSSLLLVCSCVLLVLLLSGGTSAGSGKRFDCRLFCKMTGYHGMIGGCRCSFTLFAAKRNDPLWANQGLETSEDRPEHPQLPLFAMANNHLLMERGGVRSADDYSIDDDDVLAGRRLPLNEDRSLGA